MTRFLNIDNLINSYQSSAAFINAVIVTGETIGIEQKRISQK